MQYFIADQVSVDHVLDLCKKSEKTRVAVAYRTTPPVITKVNLLIRVKELTFDAPRAFRLPGHLQAGRRYVASFWLLRKLESENWILRICYQEAEGDYVPAGCVFVVGRSMQSVVFAVIVCDQHGYHIHAINTDLPEHQASSIEHGSP